MSTMRVVAEGLRFPEGPVPLSDGSVLVVELARGTLTRVMPDGELRVVADVGGSPNGAAIGPDGRVVVCNNGGLSFVEDDHGHLLPTGNLPDPAWIDLVDLDTGAVERLVDNWEGRPLRHCNDLVFDRCGGCYVTDTGKQTRDAVERGSIYYVHVADRSVRRVAGPLISPNGVGLSPDGGTLYVSETPTARLWAWDVVEPGVVRKVKSEGVLHGGRFVVGSADYQRFDSLAVTESGRVVVATLTNGGLTEVWPDGSRSEHHPLPDSHVTNVAFGGPDRRTAFVTLAGTGRLVAVDWHEPGLELAYSAFT
jgi:gluconolactonase